MKKLLLLSATVLVFQATPVFAQEVGGDHKGGMFEKQDTNGDGVISQDEFLETARQKFAEMDKDGDGNISQEEGKAAHEAKRAKWKEKRKEMKAKRGERSEGAVE